MSKLESYAQANGGRIRFLCDYPRCKFSCEKYETMRYHLNGVHREEKEWKALINYYQTRDLIEGGSQ